ncbi:MAG: hypothetical protein J6Q12_05870 [Bacteroidales bacterium]|nr:hypothetical protein [Bacteroidales bacterium]
MKKTLFTALRAMCVGAMTLAAVSCYDDTFLRGELDELGDDVNDLAARVDSLEKNLNDNIKAVNTLEASMATLETSLKAAIEENGAAVKAALEAELTALETKLAEAIAKGDQASADALAAEKAAVETAMATLETTLTTSMTESAEKLEAAIKALETAMGVKVEELLAKMDAADGAIDGKIAELNTAVEAVKKAYADADAKLSAEVVAKIAEAVAKIAVVGVDAIGPNVVLTLADGSKIEVSKPLENVDNEGLVTVIEDENGNKYWAVIVDGEPEQLPVAVGTDVNLQFQVGEDNCLEWSTDGENWVSTGAYVNDADNSLFDFYQGSYWDDMLWEDVTDDYYTLVFGGEEYYLPLYKVDNSTVAIKAGKTYFTYGETKTIDIALTDVTSIYVMTKPEGWRANLNGKVLTVVAPDSVKVATGYAEADGEVLLHCSTAQGTCKVARLAVATTPGFSLTVTEDGKVTLINPNTSSYVDRWSGETMFDFQDAYIGLAPVADFEKDPKAYAENAQYDYSNVTFMVNVWKQNTMDWETGEYLYGGVYEEGVYEVDVIETTVGEIYEYYNYEAVPDGSRFVVWACPVDENGSPLTADIVFGYYSSPVTAKVEEVEASFTDVDFSIEVFGATEYYVGLVTEEMTYGFPIDEYMQMQEGPFGYFQMAVQYGMPEYAFQQMGTPIVLTEEEAGLPVEIKASDLHYGEKLLPDTKFYMWVFPVVDGLALEDYTYEENLKPYIYSFSTTGIAEGGAATAEFGEAELDYTAVRVPVTAEGAALVYYNFYDVETYNEIEDLTADIFENGYVTGEAEFTAVMNDLEQNTTVVLAAVVVDEDGLYGEVVEETYTTASLVYSTTFVATVGNPEIVVNGSNWKVTMPVSVTGGEAATYYYYWNGTARTEEQLSTLPLMDYYYYYSATTLPQLVYYNYYESYQFAVVVESTTGELSKPVIVTVNKPAAEETPAE